MSSGSQLSPAARYNHSFLHPQSGYLNYFLQFHFMRNPGEKVVFLNTGEGPGKMNLINGLVDVTLSKPAIRHVEQSVQKACESHLAVRFPGKTLELEEIYVDIGREPLSCPDATWQSKVDSFLAGKLKIDRTLALRRGDFDTVKVIDSKVAKVIEHLDACRWHNWHKKAWRVRVEQLSCRPSSIITPTVLNKVNQSHATHGVTH